MHKLIDVTIGMINRIVFFVILLSLTLSAQARKFVHPGILTVNKNIERMRNQIANKEYPAYGSFVLLKNHHCSKSDYKPFGPFDCNGW